MSPVFAHGQLRLYLLALLDEAPRHGYEVIRALEERFEGMYSPSAGTIYPRLARLEEEGLVVRSDEGRKAVYRITDAGRAELASRRSDVHELEEELTRSVRRMAEQVRAEVHGSARDLRAELKAAAKEARLHARDSERDSSRDRGDRHESSGFPWGDEPPWSGRGAGRDVERLIQRFRDEARKVVRSSGVDEHTVAQVRETLDDALLSIERALKDVRDQWQSKDVVKQDTDVRTQDRDDQTRHDQTRHDQSEDRHDDRHDEGRPEDRP
ncbi:MAG TPA: PadR family transcriptional regulator [Actinomycetales bacterium]|nr:PadR family transcriptional regulator [Actinomycetales bacterium]